MLVLGVVADFGYSGRFWYGFSYEVQTVTARKTKRSTRENCRF